MEGCFWAALELKPAIHLHFLACQNLTMPGPLAEPVSACVPVSLGQVVGAGKMLGAASMRMTLDLRSELTVVGPGREWHDPEIDGLGKIESSTICRMGLTRG